MKRFLTLSIALLTLTAAHAQLKIGVEAGLNINEPSFSKSDLQLINPKNSLGFFVGPKIKYQSKLGLGVDGAVLYSQKRNDDGEMDKSLSYIEVPINLRYEISILKKFGIYLAAGPQWNVYIGDRNWSFNDTQQARSLMEDYYTTAVERHNISINAGAGLLLFDKLQVGFTYNIPVTKNGETIYSFYKSDGITGNYESIKSNWKNNTWQVRLAFFF